MYVDTGRWKGEEDKMKQILKQTPITFDGVDGWEVLVKDDEIGCESGDACDKCIYRRWTISNICYEVLVTCVDVHGCLFDYQTYFEFRTEPVKQNDAP